MKQSDWTHKWSLICVSQYGQLCSASSTWMPKGSQNQEKQCSKTFCMVPAEVPEGVFDTGANNYDPKKCPFLLSTAIIKALTDSRPENIV